MPDVPVKKEKKLLQLSDSTGTLELTEVKPAVVSSLKSEDVFLLDTGTEIFVWVGAGASKNEKNKALSYATQYLVKSGRPTSLPITRVLETGNVNSFTFALQN